MYSVHNIQIVKTFSSYLLILSTNLFNERGKDLSMMLFVSVGNFNSFATCNNSI